jgi:hypothetical protein
MLSEEQAAIASMFTTGGDLSSQITSDVAMTTLNKELQRTETQINRALMQGGGGEGGEGGDALEQQALVEALQQMMIAQPGKGSCHNPTCFEKEPLSAGPRDKFKVYISQCVCVCLSWSPRCCFCCLRKTNQACAGCNKSFYCSVECQKAHWRRHKPQCLALRAKAKK